jgi:lysyl-tRNA synthetase class 2
MTTHPTQHDSSSISPPVSPALVATDELSIVAERQAKLSRWRQGDIAGSPKAFPNQFFPTTTSAQLMRDYEGMAREALAEKAVVVRLAGRMMLKRLMGKASFATVQDAEGRLQIYVAADRVGSAVHEAFSTFDLGDIVGVEGALFKTKTGELSINCSTVQLLVKSLRPLPEKFHGLTDLEQRYRQRFVDLMVNESSRQVFRARSKIISALRQLMGDEGYLEVETPMMHPIPGGAAARPFITHHNALARDMYLRVAPELYLKRLVVGGFERVFEINRNFRNEGISPRHNPEFTMMEFYVAYQDYRGMMDFTEQLLRRVGEQVFGKTVFKWHEHEINLGAPFARLTLAQAIHRALPAWSEAQLADTHWVAQTLQKEGVEKMPHSLGERLLMLFDEVAESKTIQPTFIVDYPLEVSPLARANDDNPMITDRFELFIGGREIANGFSELNDPEDQANRFRAQVAKKEAGDHEAMFFDADYIAALEYGMPPTAGCGIGIDRMVMMMTDSASIRDVILFPTLKQ